MSTSIVYLFVIMDGLVAGLFTALVCAGIAVAIGLCCLMEESSIEAGKKWLKWSLPAFILMGLLTIATPNTKQFAAIYLVPKIVNNEDVRAISGDALKMVRMKFEAYLNNIGPAKKAVETVVPSEKVVESD